MLGVHMTGVQISAGPFKYFSVLVLNDDMPILNVNHYLALHEKRTGNLLDEKVTVVNVTEEKTYDTGFSYYRMNVKGSQFPLIFPAEHETRKIGDLKKGDEVILRRCKSNPAKIAEIVHKNGEIIFSPQDGISQYVV